MLPWQHVTWLVIMFLTSIISMSNYTFIACIIWSTFLPLLCIAWGCLLLFTCKPCCLQTCNYDQSLVVMDTNTPTKCFDIALFFELWVSNKKKKKNMKLSWLVLLCTCLAPLIHANTI